MTTYQFYLGIDISKSTFNYALRNEENILLKEGVVTNKQNAILSWMEELQEFQSHTDLFSTCLVCLEHSGFYSAPLLKSLDQHVDTDIWLESALQIKRSIGVQRGKNDKIDAQRIATYAIDFQRKARLWKPTSKTIQRLGLLISHRDRMVKYLMSLRNSLKEEIGFVEDDLHLEMDEITQVPMSAMKAAIQQYDDRIKTLLEEDIELAQKTKIVMSTPGFGQIISSKLIQITHGFTRLTDPRQLACFAGVAPFEHASGTSLKGKTRISHLANKEIKKMLHLAAMVTIRKGNIMHEYFNRKVAEGKNKMSVLNAVRNKLIHILLACVKNNTIYQKK